MPRWKAPVTAGTAPPPANNCGDRASRLPPNNWGFGVTYHDYTGPCSSVQNNPDRHSVPPAFTSANFGLNGPGGDWSRPTCNVCAGGLTVCHFCQKDGQRQAWMVAATSKMDRPPPGIEIKKHYRYRGFWTRLCSDCEIAEQLLINARLRAPAAGQAAPPAKLPPPSTISPQHPRCRAHRDACQDYPTKTCTCLLKLTAGVQCIVDRAAAVQKMSWNLPPNLPPTGPSPPRPIPDLPNYHELSNRLTSLRDRNAAFLENIAWDPARQQRATASEATKTRRKSTQKKYRACRCGRDVVPLADARIFLCMACEGIIQEEAVPNDDLPTPPLAIHTRNSANRGNFLNLRGPRSATVI